MKKIFNIILFALFCASFAQAQVGKRFEFTYEGQTLKYEVANGNEAKVSKQQSERSEGRFYKFTFSSTSSHNLL